MDGCTFTFKEIEDHVAKVKQKALTSAMRNNPVYGFMKKGKETRSFKDVMNCPLF